MRKNKRLVIGLLFIAATLFGASLGMTLFGVMFKIPFTGTAAVLAFGADGIAYGLLAIAWLFTRRETQ